MYNLPRLPGKQKFLNFYEIVIVCRLPDFFSGMSCRLQAGGTTGTAGASGNPEYDVAAAKWGGTWRMPTADEFTELINNCTMESAEQDGVLGVKVTGPNGNSIFLPLGGSWVRFLEPTQDFAGYYWSSSPYGDNLERATYLFVQDFGSSITFFNNRHIGLNVRPVSD